MLQGFSEKTTSDAGAGRLRALRAAMAEAGVDAFLVPRADAHQGENVPPGDERLAWLTGFTGSAGLCAITSQKAALFVDGRYGLQARAQVDQEQFEVLRHPEDRPADWLAGAMQGGRLGFDPWLHGMEEIAGLEEKLAPHQITPVRLDNLIDQVWEDQPPPPAGRIVPHAQALAGRSAAEKSVEIAEDLTGRGISASVLSLPESIAWLLNIRGSDIARTPVALAFAILHAGGRVELFTDLKKCDGELHAHLGPDVTVSDPQDFGAVLDALSGRISLDKASAPVWICDRLSANEDAEIAWARDPCILPKAQKNVVEIAGANAAHLRDGAVMAQFLAWLDQAAPQGGLSEIDVVTRLEEMRAQTGLLRDISFETICGSGPNGAIVHYRVTEASNRKIVPGDLLLVDSGGQYADGTTDITRTVATGSPPAEAIRPFTLVLKGLIAMSRLKWPPGLAGRDLDAAARSALWAAGLDYDHGTGHGVGSYLSVHEGPQSLSRRSDEPLLEGMILSIEPGYYREGAFGIRTENLAVVRAPAVPDGGEREMLGFDILTLAPIDRRLIDAGLLDPCEREWLNGYHARVAAELGPLVDESTSRWLARACEPV